MVQVIYKYISTPIETSHQNHLHSSIRLPCIFYIVMLILLLYYPAHLLEWLYLSKKKPAVYSHTT